MARLSKAKLLERFEDAVHDSGWNSLSLSGKGEHPARYLVFRDDQKFDIRLYVWNVTHGGKSRSEGEYRIQITGPGKIETHSGARNLILGWFEEEKVFAGWDIRQHLGPVSRSPSMQVSRGALVQAAVTGFAPYKNRKGETAIGIRPDFLGTYIVFLMQLHDSGKLPKEASVLAILSTNPNSVSDASIESRVKKERKYAMFATRRALREIDFSKRVLKAYGNRCAMCGLQLRLLDAAHVLPVAHKDSTDATCNGVALCSLHHRAYDLGLVYFDSKFNVIVNKIAVQRLEEAKCTGGLVGFQKNLQPSLLLPDNTVDKPAKAFVEKANTLRRVK